MGLFKKVKRGVRRTFKVVTRPAKAVVNPVRNVVRRASRVPGLGSIAVVATGGLALADKEIRQNAIRDYQIGAAIGTGIKAGDTVGAVTAGLGGMVPGPKLEEAAGAVIQSEQAATTVSAGPNISQAAREDKNLIDYFLDWFGLGD